MSSLIIKLPAATVSSGGTIASPEWDVSDAVCIAAYTGEAPPTAAGINVEVSFRTSSTDFFPLVVPWHSHSGAAAVPAVITSSGVFIFEGTAFSKMRFVLDSGSTDTVTVRGSKQVYV